MGKRVSGKEHSHCSSNLINSLRWHIANDNSGAHSCGVALDMVRLYAGTHITGQSRSQSDPIGGRRVGLTSRE